MDALWRRVFCAYVFFFSPSRCTISEFHLKGLYCSGPIRHYKKGHSEMAYSPATNIVEDQLLFMTTSMLANYNVSLPILSLDVCTL